MTDTESRVYGKYQGTVFNNLDPQGLGRAAGLRAGGSRRNSNRLGQTMRALWRTDLRILLGAADRRRRVDRIRSGMRFAADLGRMLLGRRRIADEAAGLPEPADHPHLADGDRPYRSSWTISPQTITLTDGVTLNSVEVSVATGTVTVKGAVQVVSSAPLVKHGSVAAAHPAVLGDQLLAYLGPPRHAVQHPCSSGRTGARHPAA